MKNRKEAENTKTVGKEKYKEKITLMVAVLFGILFAVYLIVKSLYSLYMDSYYPSGVTGEETFSVFLKTMPTENYKPLAEVAEALADNGNGYLLYPSDRRTTTYTYEDSTLAKLTTSTGEGIFVVAPGTGNIQEDIINHVHDYYNFMGNTKPSYEEKVYEDGNIDNFYASYSSGYLSTGNFFKENGFHITAFEYKATAGKYLFLVYATEHIKELRNHVPMIRQFAIYALEGEVTEENMETAEDMELTEEQKTSTEQIAEINKYIEERYGVTAPVQSDSVSENTTAAADLSMASEDVEEVQIDVSEEESMELDLQTEEVTEGEVN